MTMQSRRWGVTEMMVVVVALVVVMPQQARSLYTFSCDGHLMTLHCPARQVIFVRSAMFGKKPGSLHRCGETERIHRACEQDISQFMKFKCEGIDYCQVPIELATFNLENLCPTFLKYAEVHFDCVSPHAVRHLQQCRDRCLPPDPSPSPTYGMLGGHIAGGNAVVAAPAPGQSGVVYTHQGGTPFHAPAHPSPSSSASPGAAGRSGVIYTHQGGNPVHAPAPPSPSPSSSPRAAGRSGVIYTHRGGNPVHVPAPPSLSSSSSPGAADRSGVIYTHQGGNPVHAQAPPPHSSSSSAATGAAVAAAAADPHHAKGLGGSAPANPGPSGPGSAATLSQGVMDVVRNHMQSAQHAGASQTASRQMLMAKLGQMIGAMRNGHMG